MIGSSKRSACFLLAVWLCLLFSLSGCLTVPASQTPVINDFSQPAESTSYVQIRFSVSVLSKVDTGVNLYLEILNDPAGSGLDVQRYSVDKLDDGTFQTTLSFPTGSLLQYRYVQDTGQGMQIERTLTGEPVIYRRYYAEFPGEIHDIVCTWDAIAIHASTGQITGSVTDQNGTPLSEMLVTAGGLQTISAADGSFQLQGLPIGLQNLVISSIHGTTIPFQQGAVIEVDSVTPAPVVVRQTDYVKITFLLEEPVISEENATILAFGNLYETGNNFSSIFDTSHADFSRIPQMIRLDDGRYVITLSLPVGFDFLYQYTMGDAFINTELDVNGDPNSRRLIIPNADTTITDQISRWSLEGNRPLNFSVTVPDETPSTDKISIQFDLDGWRSPLPMHRVNENTWTFTLFHPLPAENQLTYRYCRNLACTAAPAAVVNDGPPERTIDMDREDDMQVQDIIQSWAWIIPSSEQTTIIGSQVRPRGPDFLAGVELQTLQADGTQESYPAAFENISSIGANWVILTPSWHFTRVNPPRLEQVPGEDLFAADVEEIVRKARDHGLQVALYPRILLNDSPESWWTGTERDEIWWNNWFAQIRTFNRHFAWLAQENGIPVLVIGDPSMTPSYPEGKPPSSAIPSDVFSDAEARWASLVNEVHTLYQGQLMFAVDDITSRSFSPEFFQAFDSIYFLVDTALYAGDQVQADLGPSVNAFLSGQVLPFSEMVQRDVILALNYPSHPDAVNGCVETESGCIDFDVLAASDRADHNHINIEHISEEAMPNFTIQYKIYESFLRAVNENEQIMGLVSRGYYAPVERHDFSASIRGKPAAALLWYWFPRFVLSEQQ